VAVLSHDCRARVLVVEDEPYTRQVIGMRLGFAGFDVDEAECSHDAIRLYDEHPFDVVVTDIFLPGEDGISLIQDLRRRRPDLPIVAITGGGVHHDLSALRVAAALGAGALLVKPFRAEELVAAVRRVLQIAG
jgi:DNA-binding response OmpR family regulator